MHMCWNNSRGLPGIYDLVTWLRICDCFQVVELRTFRNHGYFWGHPHVASLDYGWVTSIDDESYDLKDPMCAYMYMYIENKVNLPVSIVSVSL